jgi:hypothetical protein
VFVTQHSAKKDKGLPLINTDGKLPEAPELPKLMIEQRKAYRGSARMNADQETPDLTLK